MDGIHLSSWLDGAVHIARVSYSIGESRLATTASGFTEEEAAELGLAKATLRRALAMSKCVVDVGETVAGCEELTPVDFAPDVSFHSDYRRVLGYGASTTAPYMVPADCVVMGWDDPRVYGGGIEQTVIGAVSAKHPANIVTMGIADIVRRDTLERWWSEPQRTVTAVTDRLEQALPPGTVGAVVQAGMQIMAYRWETAGIPIVMVALYSEASGVSFGSMAAARLDEALARAFLEAVRARVNTTQLLRAKLDTAGMTCGEQADLLTAWVHGAELLAQLKAHREHERAPMPKYATAVDWADVATRRFGHEPVVVHLSTADEPLAVKVLCPGAAVYRSARLGAKLPCPTR